LVCVRFWFGQVGSHLTAGKSFFVLPEALAIAKSFNAEKCMAEDADGADIFEGTGTEFPPKAF
jgi:hypothetical protein